MRALGSREAVSPEIAQRFREAADRHVGSRDHHAYKRKNDPVSLEKLSPNVRKEILSDWHSLAKRTSEDPQAFSEVKTWAQERDLD